MVKEPFEGAGFDPGVAVEKEDVLCVGLSDRDVVAVAEPEIFADQDPCTGQKAGRGRCGTV